MIFFFKLDFYSSKVPSLMNGNLVTSLKNKVINVK